MVGFGGLTLQDAGQHLPLIKEINPDICILELGTNDLACTTTQPSQLADDMLQFASSLIDTYNVRVVVINQIYFRHPCAMLTRSDFLQCLTEYHDRLTHGASALPGVICQFHKNMFQDWHQFLMPDGVHLNPHFPAKPGMLRYLLSIKAAVHKAVKLL